LSDLADGASGWRFVSGWSIIDSRDSVFGRARLAALLRRASGEGFSHP
jgi:hypothetical protein